MKCPAAKTMFSEYIDGELTQEEKEAVDFHLRECETCRSDLDELLAVHRLFASAEHFSVPYGFSTRVMANLEEKRESILSRIFTSPVLLRAVEVAFAVMIVIIGLISGNMLTAQRQPDPTSTEVRQTFALDAFEAAPSGSIGGIYVSMTGVRNER